MNPLIIGPILEIGKSLLDRFGPEDKDKRRIMEAEFLRMAAEGELKQTIAQLEINAKEAAHPSVWVAGWRPGAGWIGVAGFGYAVLLQPILTWVATVKGWPTPPTVDTELLWVVLSGMLGIGGMRTYEKAKGVASK
jgi:hypothetical protein